MITKTKITKERKEKGFCWCDMCVENEFMVKESAEASLLEFKVKCSHDYYYADKCMRCGEPKNETENI